jgi:O-acetyl-ADP-ribose deacetylase (regulator of RNase III)
MIIYKTGDIFTSTYSAIVNTVNCVGVMGAGLAKQFKEKYPQYFEEYRKECQRGNVRIGKITSYQVKNGPCIFSFPTKDHWKFPSKLEYIDSGLKAFVEMLSNPFLDVAFPMLGCQNGGLNERDVLELMKNYLLTLPNTFEIWRRK